MLQILTNLQLVINDVIVLELSTASSRKRIRRVSFVSERIRAAHMLKNGGLTRKAKALFIFLSDRRKNLNPT